MLNLNVAPLHVWVTLGVKRHLDTLRLEKMRAKYLAFLLGDRAQPLACCPFLEGCDARVGDGSIS